MKGGQFFSGKAEATLLRSTPGDQDPGCPWSQADSSLITAPIGAMTQEVPLTPTSFSF